VFKGRNSGSANHGSNSSSASSSASSSSDNQGGDLRCGSGSASSDLGNSSTVRGLMHFGATPTGNSNSPQHASHVNTVPPHHANTSFNSPQVSQPVREKLPPSHYIKSPITTAGEITGSTGSNNRGRNSQSLPAIDVLGSKDFSQNVSSNQQRAQMVERFLLAEKKVKGEKGEGQKSTTKGGHAEKGQTSSSSQAAKTSGSPTVVPTGADRRAMLQGGRRHVTPGGNQENQQGAAGQRGATTGGLRSKLNGGEGNGNGRDTTRRDPAKSTATAGASEDARAFDRALSQGPGGNSTNSNTSRSPSSHTLSHTTGAVPAGGSGSSSDLIAAACEVRSTHLVSIVPLPTVPPQPQCLLRQRIRIVQAIYSAQ
jgi:hypothetical protein